MLFKFFSGKDYTGLKIKGIQREIKIFFIFKITNEPNSTYLICYKECKNSSLLIKYSNSSWFLKLGLWKF